MRMTAAGWLSANTAIEHAVASGVLVLFLGVILAGFLHAGCCVSAVLSILLFVSQCVALLWCRAFVFLHGPHAQQLPASVCWTCAGLSCRLWGLVHV
jgi:hypothetical protein